MRHYHKRELRSKKKQVNKKIKKAITDSHPDIKFDAIKRTEMANLLWLAEKLKPPIIPGDKQSNVENEFINFDQYSDVAKFPDKVAFKDFLSDRINYELEGIQSEFERLKIEEVEEKLHLDQTKYNQLFQEVVDEIKLKFGLF